MIIITMDNFKDLFVKKFNLDILEKQRYLESQDNIYLSNMLSYEVNRFLSLILKEYFNIEYFIQTFNKYEIIYNDDVFFNKLEFEKFCNFSFDNLINDVSNYLFVKITQSSLYKETLEFKEKCELFI